MKKTKNYIEGNFLTIRLYPDFCPVITGYQSIGQRPGYDRTVQGRPALPGSSSGIFFTVFINVVPCNNERKNENSYYVGFNSFLRCAPNLLGHVE